MRPGHRFRAVLSASLALALWVLARPASAFEAPFCDDRGATGLADPPLLDASGEAVARARACSPSGDDTSYFAALARARRHSLWSPHGAAPALAAPAPRIAKATFERFQRLRCVRAPGAAVRARVDRPPRP